MTDLFSQQSRTSVLRYPGGKTRAVAHIRSFFPKEIDALASPFMGGGSIEISCAADGIKVFAADAFAPLVNFWQHAKKDAGALADRVATHHPLARRQFYILQKSAKGVRCDRERAAIFFVLNRSSFSGLTESGGMSPNHARFNASAINRLRDFRADNLEITCADYRETLRAHVDKFLYLDPPYANGGRLYGRRGDMHEGFDHEDLADRLKARTGWVLSYNDHPDIRKLYQGFDIVTPDWKYGLSRNKASLKKGAKSTS